MSDRSPKEVSGLLVALSLLLLLSSCASKPDIVGKWREVGRTAMIEFSRDGTFQAVDNQGMTVAGKYTLRDGTLRCEIQHAGASEEIVDLRISIRGDELTLTNLDGREIEIYRRDRR